MPRSQNEGVDHQHVLVDEIVPHQELDQLSTTEYTDVLARLFLEPGNRFRDVAFQQGGVAPWKWLGQRCGGDVFPGVIEHLGERVVLLVGPEAVEVLIGPSSEQQRPTFGHPPSHHPAHDLISVGHRPAAMLEAAAGVLTSPTRCLHHAIERQVLDHNNFTHLSSSAEITRHNPIELLLSPTYKLSSFFAPDYTGNGYPGHMINFFGMFVI